MSVIYRLTDGNNHFYIGSTTNLKRRLYFHRYNSNTCYSKKLCDDWTCDILEHTDKVGDDLLWLERKYFDSHYGSPLFVNEIRPIATKEEIKEYYQQYREQNADKLKEYQQQYREQNADKIKAYHQQYKEQNADKIKAYKQQYREQNADKIKEYFKQYREQNADKLKAKDKVYKEQNKYKIKAYREQKIKCECGAVITRSGKSQHLKTKKHLNFINNLHAESSLNVSH